jgi:hypothetical protein
LLDVAGGELAEELPCGRGSGDFKIIEARSCPTLAA